MELKWHGLTNTELNFSQETSQPNKEYKQWVGITSSLAREGLDAVLNPWSLLPKNRCEIQINGNNYQLLQSSKNYLFVSATEFSPEVKQAFTQIFGYAPDVTKASENNITLGWRLKE